MNVEEYKIACLDNARHTAIYCKIIYSLLVMLGFSLAGNAYLFYKFMQNAFESGTGVVSQVMGDSEYSQNNYME